MANYRSRITGLRRVKASDLTPHPENWREHPPEQIGALEGVLGDVGFAGAVLARELPDGRLQIIDGHARAERMGDQKVPVLVTDLDEAEARMVLATYDPIGAMAESNGEALTALLDELPPVDSEALDGLIEQLREDANPGTAENPWDHWQGMPEFQQDDLSPWKQLIVKFASPEDLEAFAGLIGQSINEATRYIHYPKVKHERLLGKRYADGDN